MANDDSGSKSNALHPVYSVTNIQTRVRVLDGVKVSFSSWVKLFTLHARGYDVTNHIDGTPPPAKTDQAYESWSKIDSIVLQWIYGTLNDDLLVRILDSDSTAYQAWKRVGDIFLNNKGSRAAALEHEFNNLHLRSMPSLEAYCQKLKELGDQLSAVDSPVNDQRLVLQLVRGLPAEYDIVASYINQSLPSWDNACNMLLLEQQRLAVRDSATDTPSVALATDQQSSPPPQRRQQSGRNSRGNNKGRNGPDPQRHTSSPQYGARPRQPNQWPGPFPYSWPSPAPWFSAPGPTPWPNAWPTPPPCPYPTQAGWANPWHTFGPSNPRPNSQPRQQQPASGQRQPQAHLTDLDSFDPDALSAAFSAMDTNGDNQWYMDTGATAHVTGDQGIDGGGTTVTVAGAALVHLEDQIQEKTGDSKARISDFFDLVVGTGIGALLAAMVVADDGSGRPLYSARDAARFVEENQEKLFKAKSIGVFRRRNRFSGRSMDLVLKEALRRDDGKVLTIADTCKPLLVPCFDLISSAPFVFSRADASDTASFDFEMWKVIRATTAAPSMFKPYKLSSTDGKTTCLAVDGGLVMNNPSSAAVTHVLHNKRDFPLVTGVEDLLVLSIGNGPSSKMKLSRNGECSTASVVGIVLDGVSETVDQMMGNAFGWNPQDYVRVQANGVGKDVLVERGVESLPFGGKRMLTETNGQMIGGFVQRLVAAGRSSLPPSPCKETAVSPLVNGR
ncbi:hypothetical protein CASFOL_008847 [Castilleja foliolosa]|uniref:Patatin n=1 Tax=Castilleja foliolosa TaxID=1961234 RepID=A0ABD3E150_9LAMI